LSFTTLQCPILQWGFRFWIDEDFVFGFVTKPQMGVVKSWLLSTNHTHSNTKNAICSRSIPWSVICGFMLFGLGLISLLTGHVVSHLEWYSQRFVHRSFFSTLVSVLFPFIHYYVTFIMLLFVLPMWSTIGIK
jgi:hypothetical protein